MELGSRDEVARMDECRGRISHRRAARKVRRLLRPIAMRCYRNGDDLVPDVPWMPGIYVQPRALIPVGDAALDPLVDHPIAAYRRALAIKKWED